MFPYVFLLNIYSFSIMYDGSPKRSLPEEVNKKKNVTYTDVFIAANGITRDPLFV